MITPSAHLRLHRAHPTKTLLRRFQETLPVPARENVKYSNAQLAKPLVRAATAGAYPSQAADDLRASGKRSPHKDALFNRLRQADGDEVLAWFLSMNHEILEHHRRGGSLKPSAVAIDLHGRAFYGKDKTHAIGMKKKAGTSYAHALITLERVREPRVCLSAHPFLQFDTFAKSIKTAVEEARRYQKITLLLIDSAAYSADCLETLDELGHPYIVPAPWNSKIKDRISEAQTSACQIAGTKYRAEWAQLPLGKAKPTLVLLFDDSKTKGAKKEEKGTKSKKKSVFAFVTNMKVTKRNVAQLGGLYRSRWGIETGYRVRKVYRIRTNCLKYAVRLLFMLLEILLYNLWVYLNERWDGPRPKDRYPISYHRFRRLLAETG